MTLLRDMINWRLQASDQGHAPRRRCGRWTADERVLAFATDQRALLITPDKDFRELVFPQGLIHSGVLLIRLAGVDAATKAALVAATIERRRDELAGKFAVRTERALRVRRPLWP